MNVFELFGTISVDGSPAMAAIGKTVKHANDAAKKISSFSVKVGKAVVGMGAAVGSAWMATVESTRDYRTEMAKLETAYLTSGHSAQTAMKTYQALQAVLGETDQSVEAANHLAMMCDNAAELATWTDICTGVYATFGDSLPIEGLTESANETAKVGLVTGSLADALNWAGISEEDFNLKLRACTSDQERQDLIMNTLYSTYRNAAEQYKTTGESVMKANRAQEKMNSALAKLGEIGEPIMSGMKSWVADMVTAAVPHLESFMAKFSDIGTVWNSTIWPMVQKTFDVTLGIKLPDWETFKSDLKSQWQSAKESLAGFFGIQADVDTPNTEALVTKVKEWWTGQGDSAYERVKSVLSWTFGEFIAPALDKVDAWWNGEGGGEDKLLGLLSWTLGEFIAPAIADIVTSTGKTVGGWAKEFIDGLVTLLDWGLGELGLPTVTDVVSQIHAWWNDVTSQLKLKFSALFEINQSVRSGGDPGSWENPYVSGGEYDNGWGSDYSFDGSHASGLDKVPFDGYIARLHKGEAVLNSTNAEAWRSGGMGNTGKLESMMSQLLTLTQQMVNNTAAGHQVILDSGVMVGQMAPRMDTQLGTISSRKGRRN